MGLTQSHKQTDGELEGVARRRFTRAMLNELRALERMALEDRFERGVSRIGAEQEIFLVDAAYQPAPGAIRILERLADPHFTTELGLFNLEMNADPQPLAGRGLRQLEEDLAGLYDRTRRAAEGLGMHPVMVGILPTIGKTHLGLENMVPRPRYLDLNRAMNEARGEAFDFSIRGLDELVVKHDSVMVEACNASFQVHLQVAEPERFAFHYNLAQLLLGPVLAVSTNSPVLFGKRLWSETRIALFEQACDVRSPGLHLRDAMGRVSFGRSWLEGSVVDLFKDNVTRYRALVGTDVEEDATEVVRRGGVPELKALRLHSGTIYRWNRPCYGISENGLPHLRIELRVLPSGPTITDEVAGGALWLGLMSELGATLEDVSSRLDFDFARQNLYAAAREGMAARFVWLDGKEVGAQTLVLDHLLPLAQAGLDRAGVDADVSARYLGVLDRRVRTMRSGARWTLRSLQEMKAGATPGARMTALVAAIVRRQRTDEVVSDWSLARLEENDSGPMGTQLVSQFMRTDVVTVRPDDPVELVAEIMGWERVRHMPVEDERGRLVGMVSARSVLRHLAARRAADAADAADDAGVPVSSLMKRDLVTVTPDTPMQDAIALMLRHRRGSLPVLQGEHIVAMIFEQDFVGIASSFLQPRPGEGGDGGVAGW